MGTRLRGDQSSAIWRANLQVRLHEGSVHLDWKRVDSLQSKDTFIVSPNEWTRVPIDRERDDLLRSGNDFRIVGEGTAVEVTILDVIAIGQREASSWNQLTARSAMDSDSPAATKKPIVLGRRRCIPHHKKFSAICHNFTVWSQANAKITNRFTFRFAVR